MRVLWIAVAALLVSVGAATPAQAGLVYYAGLGAYDQYEMGVEAFGEIRPRRRGGLAVDGTVRETRLETGSVVTSNLTVGAGHQAEWFYSSVGVGGIHLEESVTGDSDSALFVSARSAIILGQRLEVGVRGEWRDELLREDHGGQGAVYARIGVHRNFWIELAQWEDFDNVEGEDRASLRVMWHF